MPAVKINNIIAKHASKSLRVNKTFWLHLGQNPVGLLVGILKINILFSLVIFNIFNVFGTALFFIYSTML